MRKRAMSRMGMSGTTTMFSSNTLNYYCMSCGTKHNQASCPKCGSKIRGLGLDTVNVVLTIMTI